jgi:hypothetical protein
MDLCDEGQRAAWRDHLGELLRGRKAVCGIAPLAGLTDDVDLLRQAGAQRPLLVANGTGAGPVPDADAAEVVFVEAPTSDSMTEEVRRTDRLVRHLPATAAAAVDAYDPAREAVWVVGPFVGTAPIGGRPVVGGRPDSWAVLEDKVVVDALWDAMGVPRADSRLVAVDRDDLRAASRAVDRGAGVVWSGDARDGINGGGDFVRWVADEEDAARAYEFFAPRCDLVRVMPFLDGVPCSVHGVVLPDGTAAFRPVELAILRGPERRFVYGGQGTTWNPPDEDRAQMRDLVRRTGECLRGRVGYRGSFGIDGILTADGFRPTELNARFSGGLAAMTRSVDGALFNLLQLNLVVGRDPQVDPERLESWAVPAMDAAPFCKAIALSPQRVATEPFDVPVDWDGASLRRCERATDQATGWTVSVGPNAAGTFAKLVPPPGPAGRWRAADLNVALMRFLDAELGTAFGEVSAAPEVRR